MLDDIARGKYFSITDRQGVNTVIYQVNKTAKEFVKTSSKYNVERLEFTEEYVGDNKKKTFFVNNPAPEGNPLLIFSFAKEKVVINTGFLDYDVIKISKKPVPMKYKFVYSDEEEDYEVKEKKPSRRERKKEEQEQQQTAATFDISEKQRQKQQNKITPINRNRRQGQPGMEVCVIKPNAIEDEIEITETLLNGRTVVINMEGLSVDIAQRIIDFTSGATFAMHGNLQKISNYIFLATPNGVDISGDIQGLMESFDLPGLN